MYEAQYLFGGDAVYSPWMPRRGDNVRITLDLISRTGGSSNLRVDVFEKNSEDVGPGTLTGVEIDTSDIGRTEREHTAMKELVRYRFTGPSTATDYVQFRMISVIWFDAVGA